MPKNANIRIDKFLWAVRIFKTRSLASEACQKGRVIINSIQVKPSRTITANETLIVKKLPVIYTYIILEPIENRVGAKLVAEYLKDITPEEEKVKLTDRQFTFYGHRDKGTGRPTKKERRNIDRLKDGLDNS